MLDGKGEGGDRRTVSACGGGYASGQSDDMGVAREYVSPLAGASQPAPEVVTGSGGNFDLDDEIPF